MYNREEILAIPAGRELDHLVAMHVMGYEWKYDDQWRLWGWQKGADNWANHFSPSTDIAAAWEVVEKQYFPEVKKGYRGLDGIWMWCACFNGEWIMGKSAPEAICKAALLSLLKED